MVKRMAVACTVLAVLVALGPLSAMAQTAAPKSAGTPAAAKAGETPKAMTHTGVAIHSANTIAVCGCGMAFVPDVNTKYIEFNGKRYACCSEECHKMALADPAKMAKMADDNMAKVMAQLHAPPKTEAPGSVK